MKLENCLKCKFHKAYKFGQVICQFNNSMITMATCINDTGNVSVISCPEDNQFDEQLDFSIIRKKAINSSIFPFS